MISKILSLTFYLHLGSCLLSKELNQPELDLIKFIDNFSKNNFQNVCDKFYVSINDGGFQRQFFQMILALNFQNDIPDSNIVINYEQNKTRNFNLTEFDHNHKHTKYCHLVLIDALNINEDFEEISEGLNNLLTKKFGAILRTDLDYFFAFVQNDQVENILGMKFFQKIKFKILFGLTKNEISAYTGRFFPWPMEELKIKMNFDLSNPDLKTSELFPDFIKNFNGRRIRVSVPVRLVTFMEVEMVGQSWRTKRGSHHFVFTEIRRILNFTYVIKPSPGGGSGTLFPNGTWIGATSDVYYERADIALCTGQIYQRFKVIGTTKLFTFAVVIFTVAKPQKIFSYKVLFWPLKIDVWGLFLFVILLSIGIFCLINKYGAQGNKKWMVRMTLDFIIGSIFEQGLILTRKKNGRLFSFILLYFLLVLSIVYRAKLFELIVFPKLSIPPKTFYELADRNDYNWGLERAGIGNAPHADFRSNPHPKIKKIFAKMSLEYDSVGCFLKGLKQNFACIVYENQAQYTFFRNFSTSSRKYPFYTSKHVAFSMDWGTSLARGSVLRTNFDRIIGPLLDSGLIARYIQVDLENARSKRVFWEKNSNTKPIFSEDYFYEGARQLSIKQIEGIFIVFLLLMFASIISFLVEGLQNPRVKLFFKRNELK